MYKSWWAIKRFITTISCFVIRVDTLSVSLALQQQQQCKRRWCGFQTWIPETGPVWWPFWNPTRSEPHRLNPKSPKTMSICCCRGFTNSNCTGCCKSVTWCTPRLSKTTSTTTTMCTTNRHTETMAQLLETVATAAPWIPQVPRPLLLLHCVLQPLETTTTTLASTMPWFVACKMVRCIKILELAELYGLSRIRTNALAALKDYLQDNPHVLGGWPELYP